MGLLNRTDLLVAGHKMNKKKNTEFYLVRTHLTKQTDKNELISAYRIDTYTNQHMYDVA